MRIMFVLAASVAASLPLAAQAAVSDDLVFCSKLTSPRERISCYDAAARIAANRSPASATRPAAPALTTAPAASNAIAYSAPQQESRPFHGAYGAIGGSYGMAAPINFGAADGVSAFFGTARPAGPSALAMVGFNLQYGHLVTGLELSGRFGWERFSDSQFASVNIGVGEFATIGQSSKSYQFNSDASVHLALRAGLAVENTLIYGKLGLGAGHISESMKVVTTGSFCAFGTFVGNNLVCGRRDPIIPAQSTSTSRWSPSIMIAAGVEQNFGAFFARIEGQAEAIRGPNFINEWLWGVRGAGAVGVRF